LGALIFNLNLFRSKLNPATRLMVMVKAFAYGSGSVEVANVLQYHRVDYLGVAYADEGIELRRNNIHLPIMVMNPAEEGFETMLTYRLEPEMYGFKLLRTFIDFLAGRESRIHLKLNTGMNRLGFDEHEIDELVALLRDNPNIRVASIFSHLAGSDDPAHDDYSQKQVQLFLTLAKKISDSIQQTPILHLLNTSGILRLPQHQLDMVRLGVGLYGVDPTQLSTPLRPVATLKTIVSQVRELKKGDTIGYGRKGKAINDMTVATIAIGYADGFSMAFSNGVGVVRINGNPASIIGNVCMDMTMVDVTGLEVKEGDEVIIFGKELSIYEVASRINTIPYEILTNTSDRVRRVFVAESI
jgi:Alr-MurF fusion protein